MFGLTITTRKPRSENCTPLDPGDTSTIRIAGVRIEVENTRTAVIWLKWRI